VIPTNVKSDSIIQPSRVGPVTHVTPVTAIADLPQSAPNFTQGQKYQAFAEARLHNGNTRVLIAGQLLQMQLPDDIQPGNKIELVFIAREPQLKFLLQNATFSSPEKNAPVISTIGRLLGSLLQDTTQPTLQKLLPNTTPILANPPINSAELPSLLQKALTQSGLFYESHLAQWVAGRNTLTQLKQEPQSKLTIATMTTSISSNADTAVHTKSLPLVQQQLSTLETGHLIWRGEIWPDQLMEWDISEHSPNDNEPETGEPSSHWQMQLRLTLPRLGEVTAKIVFNSHDMHIKLHTATMEAAKLLKENRPPLAIAIASAGLSIQTVEIDSSDNE
jgi:Flagellar hook-length control protein FliK